MRMVPRFLSVMVAITTIAVAQGQGPGVGATIPAFELRDQNGLTRTMQSLMGPKGLMLVFYRSADW